RDEWAVRMIRARSLAHQGRWDEGRAEFAAAEAVSPEACSSFHYHARRAVFELKAGQTERGDALITESQEELPEATPLWLALLIEAIRYKLPKADRDRFDARWTNGQCRKPRSETAGALATLMGSFVGGEVMYEGRDAHGTQVTHSLRRSSRLRYRQADLMAVCTYLALLPNEQGLRDKMVERGLKLFPKAPWFPMIAGARELEKGPRGAGDLWRARIDFEKALGLAE